jgi:hypothetical protein
MLGGILVPLAATASPAGAQPQPETISQAEAYFPDTIGSRWKYRGQVTEGPLQKIETKGFVNVSTVKRVETFKGVTVKVFHDTNPGNHGPSDSYYRRDAVGIVYYGSHPGTPLEKQLVPYQIVRFPLVIPSSFQQFDRKSLNLGSDLDGDDKDELVDVDASVSVIGKESLTVSAGAYQDAVRIEARMQMRIRLTGSQRTVLGTDVMTAWFARGVGLVKYVERQEIPAVRVDRGLVTEIAEELEEVEIKAETASLDRGEPPAQGVLADHARHHELGQVIFPAGLRAQAGQPVPPEGLPADEGPGDRPVDVQVAHVERLARPADVDRAP